MIVSALYAAASFRSPADRGRQLAFTRRDDGVALIECRGVFAKYECGTLSTLYARDTLEELIADATVRGVVLLFDSPGGETTGVDDLARVVAAAAKVKPVIAFVEDRCLSAAYWVASQCSAVVATPASLVGGIGAYAVIADDSAAAQAMGITVNVIRSAEFKALRIPGAPVSEEQLGEQQRIVDEFHRMFVDSVIRGRGITPEAAALASDGRAYFSGEALDMGLISHVGNLSDAMALASGKSIDAPKRMYTMPESDKPVSSSAPEIRVKAQKDENPPKEPEKEEETTARVSRIAAAIAEMREACPGASADFRERCLEAGVSPKQASVLWDSMKQKEEEAKALASQLAAIKASAAPVATVSIGASGVQTEIKPETPAAIDSRAEALRDKGVSQQELYTTLSSEFTPEEYGGWLRRAHQTIKRSGMSLLRK